MKLRINDDSITSDHSRHAARLLPGDEHVWEVSWLPGRRMDRNSAITASRSFGLTVGVSPRTMARMVASRTPRARATRAVPWPMTCRARSRSRVPPASMRARCRLPLVTLDRALSVVGVDWRRPEARSWMVPGARPAAAAMAR